MKTLSVLFSAFAALFLSVSIHGQNSQAVKTETAEQIIAEIIKNTGSSIIPNTVDVIKEGDPKTQVKGVITCMFATMDVLKQAVAKNCNLIIAHEPLYYNHLDVTEKLQNDPVYLEKRKYISDHKLVIWRFHDYIHSMKPDGIATGMVAKLGWKNYLVKGETNQFLLPETTLNDLLKNLKQVFPKNAFYVIGNTDMKLTRVSLAEGAPGSATHIRLLEDNNVDVVLAGEAQQWESYEYARDAVDQGRKKAIIFLGHINSEEAGMEYCAQWLKTFLTNMPVNYVECGSSFWSY
jgi:putative NIF3 family GTP cyclohydrolase 1 type 2